MGTYTFINRTLKRPNPTGEQLSSIRIHTSKAQHQKRLKIKELQWKIQIGEWELHYQQQKTARESHSECRHHRSTTARRICPGHEFSDDDGVELNDQILIERDHQQWASRFEEQGRNNDHVTDHQAVRVSRRIQPQTFLSRVPSDSLRRDPFDGFPAPATTEVYLAIDHYRHVVASLYGAFVTPEDYNGNALRDVVIPLSLKNVHLFHLLVARSRIMHLMTEGKSPTKDATIIYHHSQALSALQLAVHDFNDDTVLLGVTQLVGLEWRLGNSRAAAMHTAGLLRIMRLRDSNRPVTLVSRVVSMMINSASTHASVQQGKITAPRSQLAETSLAPRSSNIGTESDPHSSIRAMMADSLPASLRTPVSLLPPGFQDVILASLLSPDLIELVISVSGTPEQPEQAAAIWMRNMPQVQSCLSCERNHPKFFDRWLCWAVLAHMFHHSPMPHGQTHVCQIHQIQNLGQHVIQSFATRADVKSVLELIESEAISLNVGNFAVRDCAIWSLMSVANASDRCRNDSLLNTFAATTIRSETVLDEHAVTLMAKARSMLNFNKHQISRDANYEWGVIERTLKRFWCPDRLKDEWEVMYKKMLTNLSVV